MVMGWIWTGMVLLALGAAVLTGQTGALTAAALEGAASAIRLALGLAGALCLWSGAAKALERAGGMRALARLARPVFRRLFPQTAQDETAMGYLTANVAANLLGLGNAATPMGIAAVRRMQQRSGSARATDEMCRLIVLNTASGHARCRKARNDRVHGLRPHEHQPPDHERRRPCAGRPPPHCGADRGRL